jgi:enolase-phosphatase E1
LEDQIRTLLEWIASDRKHTALKKLQGLIWKHGFESGAYISSLYDDVYPCLKKWRERNIDLAIYSSGSVQAQKLLFGHTKEGDLTPLFSNYFDTQVGHKQSEDSYTNIRKSVPSNEVWFLSDVPEELDAAKAAGIHTVQLVRPGTKACNHHPTAKDFFEVDKLLQ